MIRYYGGVEGSGKTCMMTRDMVMHHAAGGNLLTFPGYEVYGRNSNHVISKTIMPEQLLELVTGEREQTELIRNSKIAVGVDEVPNFFNHHTWYNKINDILTAILQQRRKLGVVFLMTGPIFMELPPDIRRQVHEVIHCRDLHTINKNVPIGKICEYTKEDKRGLFCHPKFPWSYRRRFRMESWYRHFDTYAAISPLNQFIKVRFKSRELLYDSDGNPIGIPENNLDSISSIVGSYEPKPDPLTENVKQILTYLKERDITVIDKTVFEDLLPGIKLDGSNGIGSILKKFGAVYRRHKKDYDLSGVSV